ncbi:MAG: hypothetical protein ACNA7Y_04150 [Gammaproteobacteria bacterium]
MMKKIKPLEYKSILVPDILEHFSLKGLPSQYFKARLAFDASYNWIALRWQARKTEKFIQKEDDIHEYQSSKNANYDFMYPTARGLLKRLLLLIIFSIPLSIGLISYAIKTARDHKPRETLNTEAENEQISTALDPTPSEEKINFIPKKEPQKTVQEIVRKPSKTPPGALRKVDTTFKKNWACRLLGLDSSEESTLAVAEKAFTNPEIQAKDPKHIKNAYNFLQQEIKNQGIQPKVDNRLNR